MKAHNHSQSVTWPPWSLADLHCMSYHKYLIIISFQRSAFNLPSLILFLRTSLYFLCSENFIFQIHLFTFKFVSFISTPYEILLLHSHLLTYKNPCILPYKNKKSLQFSSPICFRLILYTCTSVFQIIWPQYMLVKLYFDLMDNSMDTWHLCTSWYDNYGTLTRWIQHLAALVTLSF